MVDSKENYRFDLVVKGLGHNYLLITEAKVPFGEYFQAGNQRGKYQPLTTDSEVSSCFSIY